MADGADKIEMNLGHVFLGMKEHFEMSLWSLKTQSEVLYVVVKAIVLRIAGAYFGNSCPCQRVASVSGSISGCPLTSNGLNFESFFIVSPSVTKR